MVTELTAHFVGKTSHLVLLRRVDTIFWPGDSGIGIRVSGMKIALALTLSLVTRPKNGVYTPHHHLVLGFPS